MALNLFFRMNMSKDFEKKTFLNNVDQGVDYQIV